MGKIWKKKMRKNIVHRFHYFTNKYTVKEIYSKEKLSFLAKVNRGDLTLFSKPFKRAKLLEVTLSQGISTEFPQYGSVS